MPGVAIAFLPKELTFIFKVMDFTNVLAIFFLRTVVGILIPGMIWGVQVLMVRYANLSSVVTTEDALSALGWILFFVYW